MHLCHADVGDETVEYRLVRRPAVRRDPTFGASFDPLSKRVERLQGRRHAWLTRTVTWLFAVGHSSLALGGRTLIDWIIEQ